MDICMAKSGDPALILLIAGHQALFGRSFRLSGSEVSDAIQACAVIGSLLRDEQPLIQEIRQGMLFSISRTVHSERFSTSPRRTLVSFLISSDQVI